MRLRVVVILVLVEIAVANVNTTTNVTTEANLVVTKKVTNGTAKPEGISLTELIQLNTNNTRRKCKTIKKKKLKVRSTSSSSGDKNEDDESGNKESLELSGSEPTEDESKNQPPFPNATGWRKWHRRCTPCLEDMMRKWRDPSISWICGSYQRARRSFKSECMMYYRNCQDGTMFIKIADNRCSDADIPYHGKHFFYDYKVQMTDDSSSKSKSGKTDSDDTPESRSSESYEDLVFRRDTKTKTRIGKKGKKKVKTSKSSKKAKRSEKKVTQGKES